MTYEHPTWTVGLLGGVLMMLLMGLLAALGARKNGRFGRGSAWMAAGFGVYALVFVGFMLSYQEYAAGGSDDLLFGFPPPTLWLLIGIFQLPWILVFVLVRNYERWTLTADDLARFNAQVRHRQRESHGRGPGTQ